jgi:predicted secreted acid phosphatase
VILKWLLALFILLGISYKNVYGNEWFQKFAEIDGDKIHFIMNATSYSVGRGFDINLCRIKFIRYNDEYWVLFTPKDRGVMRRGSGPNAQSIEVRMDLLGKVTSSHVSR